MDTKKTKVPKKIVHSIFKKMSEQTNNDFWKQIFEQCSIGKFPKNTSYKDSKLVFRKGKQISMMDFDENVDIEEAIELALKFFKHSGLINTSNEENQLNDKNVDDMEIEIYNSWKDVKKKNVKENLLSSYMLKLKRKLNLTPKEFSLLESKISLANLFKYINYSTVIMECGKIKEILGFNVITDSRGNRDFFFPETASNKNKMIYEEPQTPCIQPVSKNTDIKSHDNNWIKMLSELHRRQVYYDSIC